MVKSIFLKAAKIVLACIFLFSSTGFTYALNESIEDFFAQNGFIYYNPDGNNGNGSDCYDLNGSATNAKVTIIGDSITEGAETYVKNKFGDRIQGKVYAKISKFWKKDANDNPSGMTILDELINKNELAPVVIFALGTNGGASKEDIYETIQKIGTDKRVIFMTVHPDQKGNKTDGTFNDIIINIANSEPNVSYFDWAATVAGKKVTLTDNVHPDSKGSKVFVDLMFQAYSNISGGAPATISADDNKYFFLDNGKMTKREILTESELDFITKHKPLYELATKEFGVPWWTIPVVQKRESGYTRKNPPTSAETGGDDGIYQITPATKIGLKGKSEQNRKDIDDNPQLWAPGHELTDEEFIAQTRLAAQVMKNKIGNVELKNDNDIKWMFFGYNGRADNYVQQGKALGFDDEGARVGEGSPYVMNGADEKRAANQVSESWKKYYYNKELKKTIFGAKNDYPPGTFLIYKVITGGSFSSGDCIRGGSNGAVAGDINATAIAFSANAPKQYVKSGGSRTDAYIEANKKYFNGGRGGGADCSAFVSTVLAASGFDPDIVKKGNTTATMGPYLSSHPEKYENITDLTGDDRTNNLSPGDIIIKVEGFNYAKHGHVELIVEVNGELKMASASIAGGGYDARYPDHVSPIYSKLNESNQWRVFRPIAK